MPTGTTTTTTEGATTSATTNNKNVSEPSAIHNKGTDTSERDVLVIHAAVCVCAGRSVREIRGLSPT